MNYQNLLKVLKKKVTALVRKPGASLNKEHIDGMIIKGVNDWLKQ